MNGHVCPECSTPRASDGAAACDCAERAAQAMHDGHTQAVAAAEDFDPLRIRPYVTIDTGALDTRQAGFPTAGALPQLTPEPTSVPAPPPPPNMMTFHDHARPTRRSPFRAVAIGAATMAVIGTAAFVSTSLFSSAEHSERALPDDPHTGSLPITEAPSPDDPASSVSTAKTADPAPSRSPFVSTTPSAPSTTASGSISTPAAESPTTAPGTAQTASVPPGQDAAPPPVQGTAESGSLRLGDSGPAVVDLQNRLEAILLYHGPTDGQYSQSVESSVRIYQLYRHIEGDPSGVYGPNTRQALEAEPRHPSQGHGSHH